MGELIDFGAEKAKRTANVGANVRKNIKDLGERFTEWLDDEDQPSNKEQIETTFIRLMKQAGEKEPNFWSFKKYKGWWVTLTFKYPKEKKRIITGQFVRADNEGVVLSFDGIEHTFDRTAIQSKLNGTLKISIKESLTEKQAEKAQKTWEKFRADAKAELEREAQKKQEAEEKEEKHKNRLRKKGTPLLKKKDVGPHTRFEAPQPDEYEEAA